MNYAQPRLTSTLLLLAVAAALSGCATPSPVVYQKAKPNGTQSQRVAQDVAQCRARAQAAVGINARSANQAAQSGARAGTIGFAATAVGAVVNSSKDAWQRARAAAAAGVVGAATKAALEWNDPDDAYQEYVERCLSERGHEVLGWR